MNQNLFFLTFSLLSWGWLCGTWPAVAALLLIIIFSRLSGWRWTLSRRQFYRYGDLATLLVIVLLADVYLLQQVEGPIFVLLEWMPVLFAPLLLAQLFSSRQKLPLAALFYSLRRSAVEMNTAAEDPADSQTAEIDVILPYAGLTVLSAGAANVQTPAYFILAATLFAGVVLSVRPRHQPLWLCVLGLSLAGVAGYYGYHGLRELSALVEEKSLDWFSDWDTDPFRGHTAIGDVGELKLSDRIEFRVNADGPLLLHQASYDLYQGRNWTASMRKFSSENPLATGRDGPLKQLEIFQQIKGEAVLALPDGTVNISGLDDAILQYGEMGAVKVSLSPRFARYQVFYTGRRNGAAGKYDLQIPKQHLDWLQSVSSELQLAGQTPEAVTQRIKSHFQQRFLYSLYLGAEKDADSALREFMLKRKAGHCEYFAAASVLLLRQAGIPARLATGYSVHEYDSSKALYIVRSRHAHAWALAYINGEWRAVDSTPAQWQVVETGHAGFWQPLGDAWSNFVFYFRQWQMQQAGQHYAQPGVFAILLLTIYLAWRLYRARRSLMREKCADNTKAPAPVCLGRDSEFYLIEQTLRNTALARQDNESLQQWVRRLEMPELQALCRLHYRLRFDPAGLSGEQRCRLQREASAWAEGFQRDKAYTTSQNL